MANIFYDKKKLPPPPSIAVTIDANSLTKVKAKRVLGIIIDEYLTSTMHMEHIIQKCKIAYNRLTLFPDLSPHFVLQLYNLRSKLEFGCTVWGFRIHNVKHLKPLESAQGGVTSLILKTIKSTSTDALESERSILPTDLRLEELQQYEAVKLLIKEDDYIQSNMIGRNKAHKMGSPFENLRSLTKQILQLSVPLENTNNVHCGHWYQQNHDRFYGWVSSIESWPNWIWCDHYKKQGRISTPIKIAKAVKCMGPTYEGKLEAVEIATEYARDNLSPSIDSLYIFSDCQSAKLAVTSQNKENYHYSTVRGI